MLLITLLNYYDIILSYGTDSLFMKWDDVNCASSSYLSIAQCTYSTIIDSGCTNSNSYDATVYCYKIICVYIYLIDAFNVCRLH